MKYILCGILGVVLGFLIFYLLFRIVNRKQLFKRESAKKKREADLYKGCIGGSPFYLLCGPVYRYQSDTYRLLTIRGTCHIHSNPDTTVIALYCWKAKAENIIKIKQGYPEETKDISVDLNNITL